LQQQQQKRLKNGVDMHSFLVVIAELCQVKITSRVYLTQGVACCCRMQTIVWHDFLVVTS
jgi:hypothetical protein